MANPYRRAPAPEPEERRSGAIELPTVIFGFLCALGGEALGGPACGLFATLFGVALILMPGRPPR